MPRPYPSLKALRVFEAAARHLSFKKAAAELHVTPAAVSLQIRLLEAELGAALFRRGNRSVELTEHGRAMLPEVQAGFTAFSRAMARLSAQGATMVLNVAAAPAFASKWLVVHLDRFPAAYPDLGLAIRVHAVQELMNYTRDGIDIGIRYGLGDYKGLSSERLLQDSLVPVCSPSFLAANGAPGHPGDLARLPFLHDDSLSFDPRFPVWDDWLAAAGAFGVPTAGGLRFNSATDAITAAIKGQGLLLARRSLVGADIQEGRLVRLFDIDFPLDHGFHVVYRKEALERREVRAFRDWLFRELPPDALWL